jgi:hypothetical protein
VSQLTPQSVTAARLAARSPILALTAVAVSGVQLADLVIGAVTQGFGELDASMLPGLPTIRRDGRPGRAAAADPGHAAHRPAAHSRRVFQRGVTGPPERLDTDELWDAVGECAHHR